MASLQHVYEDYLIRQLPPNAQHLCEFLLAHKSLAELLQMRDQQEVDMLLMQRNNVNPEFWSQIVKAVTLAKVTYFEPTALLDQERILLLVKLAIEASGFRLDTPLPQIVAAVKADYPRLTNWLIVMAKLLASQRQTAN